MKYQRKPSEREIEGKLVESVKSKNGLCLKFVSPSCNGFPDRLVILPGGNIAFVEIKASGENMRPLQLYRKKQLERLGFPVYCIDGLEQIGGVIDDIQAARVPKVRD